MKNNRVYNFFECLLKNRRNKIIIGIITIIFCVLLTFTFSANIDEEIKQVDFESSGWKNQEPGSWHIDKSADWTGERTARVQFDVSTIEKEVNANKDVILILDVSGSMVGDKIEKVKSDAKELAYNILSNKQNRVALISFDTNATILSEFTDDFIEVASKINQLGANGTTNYADALRKTGTILENYSPRDNTDLLALFLSDGYPCEETPYQVVEHAVLKDNYPYLTINAIQYEMGSDIINELKEISDNQYSAYVDNLGNVLFDAVVLTQSYDKFVINDFIDERYFELGTIENVNVSIGSASLSIEDGMEKVTWDLGINYRTGASATMTIDLKLKDGVEITDTSLFPTNRKEDVTTKLPDEPEKDPVESPKTPKLKGAYKVIYDTNTPNGCSITNPNSENYLVFDTVTMKDYDLSNKCSGYLFKGWEISDESATGITKVTDDTFIMPSHNVTIKAIWTQVSISKTMTAEEYTPADVMPFNGERGYLDNESSDYVDNSAGIKFNSGASATNGKGLYIMAGTEEKTETYQGEPIFYYRGAVDNNNVLFANKCWQIVRTTETGGTKLIYNGLPFDDGTCYGYSNELSSVYNNNYNSPADVGYMYGTRYEFKTKEINSSEKFLYGTSVTYSNGKYTLNDARELSSSDDKSYTHYTCFSSSNTCTIVNYVYDTVGSYHYIELKDGKTIEKALEEMFENKTDSTIKDYIENTWFAGPDGMLSYDDYLEDTVWCNDRAIFDLGGWNPNGGTTTADLRGANYSSRYLRFSPYYKGWSDITTKRPSLICENPNDRFTVSSENGNGKSKYKVGLLTIDEAWLAGAYKYNSTESYLGYENMFWLMSPSHFTSEDVHYINVKTDYNGPHFSYPSINTTDTSKNGVRPVISLKPGIVASSGDGSQSNPYRIS